MNDWSIIIGLMAASAMGSLVRAMIGPTVWDRMLGLGLTTSKVTLGIMLASFLHEEVFLLDLAMLFSMLGFLVTVLLARFVERKGVL